MIISKFKVITKYLTGGLASVVEYILDKFNDMIGTLQSSEVAKYAQLAKDISTFVINCCVLITSDSRREAAQLTATCFGDLAVALLDSKLTADELEAVVATVKSAVEAWKKA